jgi:anhydro-N-acetylmuramic acid kinase
MVYKVIGLMSGSSLDGLDIVLAEITEHRGEWSFEIMAADCYPYDGVWKDRLQNATHLSALDYALLHTDYGHYLGQQVAHFINENGLHYKAGFIASHGHTTFHMPGRRMTAQLGDGAAIAAETGMTVISDLRAVDVAFGGQGAPIVPIGEKLFWKDYNLFLNIGGIANLSVNKPEGYIAFDVCAANRVLNALAQKEGKEYDAGGEMAAGGQVDEPLLQQLNALAYYGKAYPKSLANDFGTDEVLPMVEKSKLSTADALRTYTEHISVQVKAAISNYAGLTVNAPQKLLVTGGGAYNTFLIQQLQAQLQPLNIEVVIPDEKIVAYKEALVMALIGVLRWRQEYNVFSSVTGAARDSIGGALWIGQEA